MVVHILICLSSAACLQFSCKHKSISAQNCVLASENVLLHKESMRSANSVCLNLFNILPKEGFIWELASGNQIQCLSNYKQKTPKQNINKKIHFQLSNYFWNVFLTTFRFGLCNQIATQRAFTPGILTIRHLSEQRKIHEVRKQTQIKLHVPKALTGVIWRPAISTGATDVILTVHRLIIVAAAPAMLIFISYCVQRQASQCDRGFH